VEAVRKPEWIRSKLPAGDNTTFVNSELKGKNLNTVCEEAKCPNKGECWDSGTATFMLMGNTCTRHCSFCAVKSARQGEVLDKEEPHKIAEAVRKMRLNYVVLTSVDRDDLPDLGAGHFANCIKAVKKEGVKVEVLIPDFQGRKDCLEKIVKAKPDVIGHNIEVVERLQRTARDVRASYKQSLRLIHNVKGLSGKILTKSGLMLGLGEKKKEILKVMDDLLGVGCDFLTIGQYLQPTKKSLMVYEYVKPEAFDELKKVGVEKGFKYVASGPLVRSSYMAGDFYEGKVDL
tara:strand:+ start:2650 stop:3516 length:867 start_codon:yes stop_codon:yes gene_type:complete